MLDEIKRCQNALRYSFAIGPQSEFDPDFGRAVAAAVQLLCVRRLYPVSPSFREGMKAFF